MHWGKRTFTSRRRHSRRQRNAARSTASSLIRENDVMLSWDCEPCEACALARHQGDRPGWASRADSTTVTTVWVLVLGAALAAVLPCTTCGRKWGERASNCSLGKLQPEPGSHSARDDNSSSYSQWLASRETPPTPILPSDRHCNASASFNTQDRTPALHVRKPQEPNPNTGTETPRTKPRGTAANL